MIYAISLPVLGAHLKTASSFNTAAFAIVENENTEQMHTIASMTFNILFRIVPPCCFLAHFGYGFGYKSIPCFRKG
jgi:hypothetical protein